MAKFKPSPLSNLMGEIVWNGIVEKGNGYDVDSAPSFRAQVPVKEGLAAQDTFKQDATKVTSRADVELRRMHIRPPAGGDIGGKPIDGSNMFDELGGGTGKSAKEFTSNKTA
jgi:hypothetical protein